MVKIHSNVCLLGLLTASVSAVTTWTDATAAMTKIETIVAAQAGHLQKAYAKVKEAGANTECPHQNMCSSSWPASPSTPDPSTNHFLNRKPSADLASGTCTRLDLDKNGLYLNGGASPIGGRVHARGSNPNDSACKYKSTVCMNELHFNRAVQVARGGALPTTTKCVWNMETRSEYLSRTGCISSAQKGKCSVNAEAWGTSTPHLGAPGQGSGDLGSIEKWEVCSSNELLSASAGGPTGATIKEVAAEYPQTAWHFSGFQQTGMYRNWPSIYQCRTEKQCSGCSDARFRGWYAGAASGPKDVVIIIDKSGSMGSEGRMAAAKTAAQWAINTLTATDHASVVTFGDNAIEYPGGNGRLLPMTEANRASLKQFVGEQSPSGRTFMKTAFTKAFDILDVSRRGGSTSGCSQIILFLSDGEPTAGEEPEALITQRNGGRSYEKADDPEAQTAAHHTRIFTYAFGDNAPTALMKRIACANSGVFQKIGDSDKDELKAAMASYFVYLAAGLPGARTGAAPAVTWTDQYEDGQGMGRMTGACSPVFDTTKTPVQLLSVNCLALPVAEGEQMTNWSTAYGAAMQRRMQCPELSFTYANLEALRKVSGGSASMCDASAEENKAGAIVGGVIGVLVFVGLAFGVSKSCGNRRSGPKTQPNMNVQQVPVPQQQVQVVQMPQQQVQMVQQPGVQMVQVAQVVPAQQQGAVVATAPPQYKM
eukprot:g2232.t1